MTVTAVPILITDLAGAGIMIVLSFLCLRLAWRLKTREPQKVIWTYLLWVCVGLAGFAVSRSAGHILRLSLVLTDHDAIWETIRPYSGAFNTLMFAFVASVTLFFETVWTIYRQVIADKRALEAAHEELLYLNQNLERLVIERTEALVQSERRYRRIFEISRDIIAVTNADGAILDLNPIGNDLLGNHDRAGDPIGRQLSDFFADPAEWSDLLKNLLENGFVVAAEALLMRPGGRPMQSLISGSMDQADSGEPATIHFLIKDIERFRQIEKQMAQADKLASIGELSAGLAHEINNPLGIILGYTQLLLRREDPDPQRRNDLKTIEKHVRNCKSIVEDLLRFARSSPTTRAATDIHHLITGVLQFIQPPSHRSRIALVTDFDGAMPPLQVDEKKIRQVLINLIMNARHAVGETGTITVSTVFDPRQENAFIRVRDDGHGIANEHMDRIFDPFFTTKPTGEGTGLGLSVSYGIIKDHGGDIFVESTPENGSEFTIALPAPTAARKDGS